MKKEVRGITLVALLITIIVLLILAGVSIAMLAGENGILGNSQKAIGKSENAQIQENATLADYENQIAGGYLEGTRNANANNYSSNETEIGTWIDGKKLYRRVYAQTTASDIDISGLNYDYIKVDSRMYMKYTVTGQYYWTEGYYIDGTERFYTLINDAKKIIYHTVGTELVPQKIFTVVEYTKNT